MDEEVYIRPLTVEDASTSYKWRNDAEVWRYTGSKPDRIVTEEMEREWAQKVISDPARINYAICLRPSDKYIGNIYLVDVKDGCGELGCFIGDRNQWGKGYAQKALHLMKKLAYSEFGVKEISIRVNKDNVPALETYLKSGAKIQIEGCWIHLLLANEPSELK